MAAERGNYRAAGAAGVKTVVLGAAAVVGAAQGVGALTTEGASAAGVARAGQQLTLPFFNPPRSSLPPYGGGKVSGVLHVPGNGSVPPMSGIDGPSQAARGQSLPGFNGNQLTHVGGHAAAFMRIDGSRVAVLDINKVPCSAGPGGGCAGLLPRMLPEGAVLTVRGPGGYSQIFVGTPD